LYFSLCSRETKKKVLGLDRGPLSLVSTTEELLESSGPCLENREYGRRDPSHWPRGTIYPQQLAITSPTSGCRSVGIVRSRTRTIEFSFSFSFRMCLCKTPCRVIMSLNTLFHVIKLPSVERNGKIIKNYI
jgi:hypothetical protein